MNPSKNVSAGTSALARTDPARLFIVNKLLKNLRASHLVGYISFDFVGIHISVLHYESFIGPHFTLISLKIFAGGQERNQ